MATSLNHEFLEANTSATFYHEYPSEHLKHKHVALVLNFSQLNTSVVRVTLKAYNRAHVVATERLPSVATVNDTTGVQWGGGVISIGPTSADTTEGWICEALRHFFSACFLTEFG